MHRQRRVLVLLLGLAGALGWVVGPPGLPRPGFPSATRGRGAVLQRLAEAASTDGDGSHAEADAASDGAAASPQARRYDLGLGKNRPVVPNPDEASGIKVNGDVDSIYWNVPDPVSKPPNYRAPFKSASSDEEVGQEQPNVVGQFSVSIPDRTAPVKTRRMVARDDEAQRLRGLVDEDHYGSDARSGSDTGSPGAVYSINAGDEATSGTGGNPPVVPPTAFYPDIDLSIPDTVYCPEENIDLVWDLLRWEAFQQAQQEPLLVSFLHSTILNHRSLESSLAFLLANRLQSPAMMISTQLQSLILDALRCPTFRRALRADIMAVRDRDPACAYLPDVFLYFKGFHALQSHRAAHVLWRQGRQVLALYLQSQVSQIFQIDIHPNATLGSGIMLDHGTGIVIGETASVGHNCSILHHVTLGGSGKKGLVRHPQVGDGVLLGAGATVLGPVSIGEGCQVGAGTLVISDLPAHCVAVGVPARIIGSFVDVTQQPSRSMDQMMDDKKTIIFTFESEGI